MKKKVSGALITTAIFFAGFALAFTINLIWPGGRTANDTEPIQIQSLYTDPAKDTPKEESIEMQAPKGLAYVFNYKAYFQRPLTTSSAFPDDDRTDIFLVDQDITLHQISGNLGKLLREKLVLPDTTAVQLGESEIEFVTYYQIPTG